MTSAEILNHEFEELSDGSYSKESVDAYVREISKAYGDLFDENKEIVRRLTIFAKKLEEYKRNENYMTETLLTAQKTAAQTISGAEAVVAKMIEAAKNEGRKIVNEARERSNAIYADRDKILADAQKIADEMTEKAEKAYDEARAEAEQQAQSIIDDAKNDLQKTIDEINGSADSVIKDAETAAEKIIEEAKAKAQTIADGIITDAETMRNESFEMKKLAVLYKDETVKEAKEFAQSVSAKAKIAAAGILLRAQADVNRVNDELTEKTNAANTAIEEMQRRYEAIKAITNELYMKFTSQLAELPVVEDLPESEPVAIDETAFVSDSDALDKAVADEDIEAVLKCFGIDSDEMMKSTELIIATEAEKIKKKQAEEAAEAEAQETEAEAETETADEPLEEVIPEQPDESAEDGADGEEAISESDVQEEIPSDEPEDNGIETDFEFNLDFDDAEKIPEAGEEVDYIETDDIQDIDDIADDFSIDTDSLFDGDWDEISDYPEDDDVKIFVPEIPEQEDSEEEFIMTDDSSDDSGEVQPESDLDALDALDDDFEIDFSMFEVDEDKKKPKEAESPNNSSHKKKKKKKR